MVVPWLPQPLHVFNVHLKAFNDATNGPRRAAEARCISNWFATTYLTGAFKNDPYVLVGDMNEDIYKPRSYEQDAIGTLISSPTGLKLTTPLNPITGSEKTWDSPSPTIRFDYVFPSGLLFSNYVSASSLVFRSDLYDAQHPLPPGVSPNATLIATDHLPVMNVFNNPYCPFQVLSATNSGSLVMLRWQSQIGTRYRVESSAGGFSNWTITASNLVATATNYTWTTASSGTPFLPGNAAALDRLLHTGGRARTALCAAELPRRATECAPNLQDLCRFRSNREKCGLGNEESVGRITQAEELLRAADRIRVRAGRSGHVGVGAVGDRGRLQTKGWVGPR